MVGEIYEQISEMGSVGVRATIYQNHVTFTHTAYAHKEYFADNAEYEACRVKALEGLKERLRDQMMRGELASRALKVLGA